MMSNMTFDTVSKSDRKLGCTENRKVPSIEQNYNTMNSRCYPP